jgi:predicted DCC family thiol-disulfide oxidoreductase YuxK
MNTPLLIFDGDCGFCTSCAEWARRRLRDRADIDPWQRLDLAAHGLTESDVLATAWWIDDRDRARRGHRAVGWALKEIGGVWTAPGLLCLLPPFSWIATVGYRLVARYRHRMPGGTPACRAGPAEVGHNQTTDVRA